MADDSYTAFFTGSTSMSVTFPAVDVELVTGVSVRYPGVTVPLEPGVEVVYAHPDRTGYYVRDGREPTS